MDNIEGYLQDLISADNQVRNTATAHLESFASQNPPEFAVVLSTYFLSPNQQIQWASLNYFQSYFLNRNSPEPYHFSRFSTDQQDRVLNSLALACQSADDSALRNKISDILGHQELWQGAQGRAGLILNMLQSNHISQIVISLKTIENIIQHTPEIADARLVDLLLQQLAGDKDIKEAAFIALCQVCQWAPTPDDLIAQLQQVMLEIVPVTSNPNKLISNFTELIEAAPDRFSKQGEAIIQLYINLTMSLPIDLKSSAVEGIGIVLKTLSADVSESTLLEVLKLAVGVIELQISQDVVKDRLFESGKELLSVIDQTQEEAMRQFMTGFLQQVNFQQPDKVFSMLILTSCSVNSCKQIYLNHQTEILQTAIASLNQPNSRLQWAALQFLSEFYSSSGAEIPLSTTLQIIQILNTLCQGLPSEEQCVYWFECLENILKGVSELAQEEGYFTLLQSVSQMLLTIFEMALSANMSQLLQQILKCLTILAQTWNSLLLDGAFLIINGIFKLVSSEMPPEQLDLKSECIRCIGAFISTLPQEENIIQAVQVILQEFLKIKEGPDDINLAVLEVMPSIAGVLQEKFDILEKVLAELLEYIQVEIKVYVAQGKSDVQGENLIELPLDPSNEQDSRLVLNSGDIIYKIQAAKILLELVRALRENFQPLAQNTIRILMQRIDDPSSDFVKATLETLALLLNIQGGQDARQVLSSLFGRLQQKSDQMSVKRLLKGIYQIFEAVQIQIDRDFGSQAMQVLLEITQKVQSIDQDSGLNLKIMQIFNHLIRQLGPELQIPEILVHYFTRLLQDSQENNILSAVCFISDLYEYHHTGPIVFERLSNLANSKNSDIRQSACFALGQSACFDSSTIQPYFQQITQALIKAFTDEQLSSLSLNANDNAVGALFRLYQKFMPEKLKELADYLPLMHDVEEAEIINEMVVELSEDGAQEWQGVVGRILTVDCPLSEEVREKIELIRDRYRG